MFWSRNGVGRHAMAIVRGQPFAAINEKTDVVKFQKMDFAGEIIKSKQAFSI
jgi:hypothetical protein